MSHVLIQALGAIRTEYDAARASLAHTLAQWDRIHHAYELTGQELKHLRDAAKNLEATYLVRLFARFEAILRDQFPILKPGLDVPENAAVLIDQLGAHRGIEMSVREAVHTVRRYRNSIAHERPGAEPVPFSIALARLNQYLNWFPTQ